MKSQEQQILRYLRTGKTLTAKQATRKFAAGRPAARICVLRGAGHIIHTVMIKRRCKRSGRCIRYAQYVYGGKR